MNSSPPESYCIRDPNGVFRIASRTVSLCALLIASHNTAHALPILTSGSVQSTLTLVTPANSFSLTTTATSPIGIFNQALGRLLRMDPRGDGTYDTSTQDTLNQWWVTSDVRMQLYGSPVSPLDGSGNGSSYAYLNRTTAVGGPYTNGAEQYYTLGQVGGYWGLSTFGTLSGSTSQTVAFEITADTPMGRVWLNNSGTEVTLANSLAVGTTWFLFQYDNSSELVSSGSYATFNSAPSNWHVNVSTVPEPSAYAIALAGLAYGGFSVWRRRKRGNKKRSAVVAASFALAAACLCTTPAHAVTIDMVTVGNPGNANDPTTGYGAVNYEYRIGKYEVTIQQYADFLNAVAATDTYSLYNPNMSAGLYVAGISQSGSSGSYTYSVIGPSGSNPPGANSPGNRPIAFVDWWDAARFTNWMSNGQPTGVQGPTTTENGAYDLLNWSSGTAPAWNAANPNTGSVPLYRIPTENEWYKAAYYKGGGTNAGYWQYATQVTGTAPGNTIGSGANQANCDTGVYSVTQSSSFSESQNYLTNVGAFTGSPSAYGTFDQSGNVSEWNDLTGSAGSQRGFRGGGWDDLRHDVGRASRSESPMSVPYYIGFRLASPAAVPEPSAYAMALAGLAFGSYSLFRQHKRA